ncbi:hypothetical protein ATJ97_3231 [Georgenia soli]|uniref:ATP synthase protein I n=1 Tax=Georgenia soli TaxID=638953 RepID=A0A2A9EP54_9MICO|nr:hypothetical protein [Georgenia soli]PFG40698.1 hypothetical protein ATJ97_3231 [Georgenia soli]
MSENPHQVPDETSRATRNMYSVILRRLGVLVVGLAVLGSVVGYLVAGTPGVWGALMGAGIAALFMVGTVATMMLTADKPLPVATAAGVGGWLVKMLLLFGVLLIVRDREFYSPGVFFVVLVLAILGSLGIEMAAVLRARVPTVDLSARPSTAGTAGTGEARDPEA